MKEWRPDFDGECIRWYDRPLAALIFFTRLPLWRWRQPPRVCYRSVVEYWPLAGWITGSVMGGTLLAASWLVPWPVAVAVAIVVRMLLTGALHEDGLADFVDGFGGGTDRARILSIMKDSHIGTYGTLALVLYVLALWTCLWSLPPAIAALTVMAGDPLSKMLSGQLIMMMPYARREEEAKSRTVYRRPSTAAAVLLGVQGLLPATAFILLTGVRWDLVLVVPGLVMYFLYLLIWRRLRGYTGDCCGAVCLLVELAFYVMVCTQAAVLQQSPVSLLFTAG
jgi:adenosylcobinamide-GDP ribazoletransferase